MATLATANGVIDLFSSSGCSGSEASGSFGSPANCDGGCVQGSWESAREGSHDSGYISTHRAPMMPERFDLGIASPVPSTHSAMIAAAKR
ncbi:hypothetical protein F4860DRAFT_517711 [Xylaria cubensis]|nr:hypothetical protein F4860DRAFT_517711 [Xylaria cubensis]